MRLRTDQDPAAASDQRKHAGSEQPGHSLPLTHARHDDITYPSIAKAFGLELKLYDEAYRRMREMSKVRPNQPPMTWDHDSPAVRARLRMVELPTDPAIPPEQQFLFPREDLWVPVCVVNGNVHILPGVPRLCESFSHSVMQMLFCFCYPH